MMSFYDTLKSLGDEVFLPHRARKGARRVGDPCRVRKEGWLEPPAGARIRKKEKISHPLIFKKIKAVGGVICGSRPKHGIVPRNRDVRTICS